MIKKKIGRFLTGTNPPSGIMSAGALMEELAERGAEMGATTVYTKSGTLETLYECDTEGK